MKTRMAVPIIVLSILFGVAGTMEAALLNSQGRLTMLRVHDVGTKYGPPTDQIDVEVVIQLDTKPGMSFGFQLRNDAQALARQGMLDLLRDAYENQWVVNIDYLIDSGKKNGVIIRTWVKK
ncbi:MAG: hypothetical protein VR64_03915 [Desulfatitalea sp. BRH_c12]|nr:MAG: hypothetical protein VR64_03915 [Desulfatitalea sp. BRH_c12]